MKYTAIIFGLLLLPSVSFAAPLTVDQANSLISVVQSSPTTPASAFTDLITAFSNITVNQANSLINVVQQAPGVAPSAFVNMLIAFTVDAPTITQPILGSTNTPPVVDNTPTQPAPVVQSVPMTPTITVVPWLYAEGDITKNPTTIPVSTPQGKKYQIIYTVSVSPDSKWVVDIIYPSKADGNPQGDVKMSDYPSKDVNDFAYRLSGAFYAYQPGTYTTTFVAHNGTDTATTTSTITVQ